MTAIEPPLLTITDDAIYTIGNAYQNQLQMKYSDIHKIEYKIKTSSANDVTYTDRFLYFYDKKDKLLDKVNFSNAEGADFNTIQKQIKERAPHIEWIYPS